MSIESTVRNDQRETKLLIEDGTSTQVAVQARLARFDQSTVVVILLTGQLGDSVTSEATVRDAFDTSDALLKQDREGGSRRC